uniref:WD_REPEATS_REGION domain-containing protein n=1 Tax=Parastrongyloides trichosuri TaxID=131310 RepID=A0A0N4ZC92_PARTI
MNLLVNDHQLCVKESGEHFLNSCNLESSFENLNKMLIEKNRLMNDCIHLNYNFDNQTKNKFEEEFIHTLSKDKINYCKNDINIPTIAYKFQKNDSCWLKLNHLNKACSTINKCCPLTHMCSKRKRYVILAKQIRRIHIDITKNIIKCKNKFKSELDLLLKNSIQNDDKIVHNLTVNPNHMKIRNNINLHIEKIQHLHEYYTLLKSLAKQLALSVMKKTTTYRSNVLDEKKNFSEMINIKRITENNIDKKNNKRINLPIRYNENQTMLKSINIKNKVYENKILPNDINNKSHEHLEIMSKDWHVVNISKANNVPLLDKSIENKIIYNIMKILSKDDNEKYNETFFEKIREEFLNTSRSIISGASIYDLEKAIFKVFTKRNISISSNLYSKIHTSFENILKENITNYKSILKSNDIKNKFTLNDIEKTKINDDNIKNVITSSQVNIKQKYITTTIKTNELLFNKRQYPTLISGLKYVKNFRSFLMPLKSNKNVSTIYKKTNYQFNNYSKQNTNNNKLIYWDGKDDNEIKGSENIIRKKFNIFGLPINKRKKPLVFSSTNFNSTNYENKNLISPYNNFNKRKNFKNNIQKINNFQPITKRLNIRKLQKFKNIE